MNPRRPLALTRWPELPVRRRLSSPRRIMADRHEREPFSRPAIDERRRPRNQHCRGQMVTSAQDYEAEKPDGSLWQRTAARAVRVLRRLVHGFFAHNCLIGASALSYSTILSFLPL